MAGHVGMGNEVTIYIRAMRSDDRDELARIYRDCRDQVFTWLDKEDIHLEDFDKDTEGEIIHVAEVDGQLAGFVSVWEPERFIHHLFVAAPYRSQGVGTALLDSLESWLPYPHQLKCAAKNQRALAFYTSRDWHEVGRAKDPGGISLLLQRDCQGTAYGNVDRRGIVRKDSGLQGDDKS